MSSLASSPQIGTGDHPALSPSSSDPEFRFLLSCCAIRMPRDIYGRDSRSNSALDWQRLLRLAEHHSVTPLVYQALRSSTNEVPQAVVDELRLRYEHNARRNLVFASELLRVLKCLEAHGIDAVPYKGPVLAETLYGDLAQREFSDLDVLVRPADVARAREALQSLSYVPNIVLSPAQQRAYLRSGYEYAFDGPLGKNLLEMQWAIVPRFFSVDFDIERFFEHAIFAEVAGHRVKTLSSEDLLLSLCVHAAKHAWIRLCWLRDIATVTQLAGVNWDFVYAQAKELGILRIVGVSLTLANRLLAASLPEAAMRRFQTDKAIAELSDRVAASIPESEEYSTESLAYFRLMMRLRERPSDRIRFAIRLALTPSVGEWAVVNLPVPFFPLYRIVRLFRVAGRLFSLRSN